MLSVYLRLHLSDLKMLFNTKKIRLNKKKYLFVKNIKTAFKGLKTLKIAKTHLKVIFFNHNPK
jgi:hypothetical protein